MKFKLKFHQSVEGFEICEAVIEAQTKEEALVRLLNRDFTHYLVMKQEVDRQLIDEIEPEFIGD